MRNAKGTSVGILEHRGEDASSGLVTKVDFSTERQAKICPQRGDVFEKDGLFSIVVSQHSRGDQTEGSVGFVEPMNPSVGLIELPLSAFQALVWGMTYVETLDLPEHAVYGAVRREA